MWGVRERLGDAVNAAVGLLGSGTVLLSALLPAFALLDVAAKADASDTAVAACAYLALPPMVVLFALRVLWHAPATSLAEAHVRKY